jgi:hypothetical protein
MAPDQVPDRKGGQMSAVIEVTGLHKCYGGTVLSPLAPGRPWQPQVTGSGREGEATAAARYES